MASCVSTLVSVSRFYILSRQLACLNNRSYAKMVYSSPCESVPDKKVREKAPAQNTSDIFGTLSPARKLQVVEALGSERFMSKEDLEEEKYTSFEPADRKNIKQSEEEILQLINSKRLKEALYFLEVTMKEDKVKPSKIIYSMLIGACGRAGYTKKAFQLYNDVRKTKTINFCVFYILHYILLNVSLMV